MEIFDGFLRFLVSHINLSFYPFLDHYLTFAVTHLTQLTKRMSQVSQSNRHQVYQAVLCGHLLPHRPNNYPWSSRVVLCLRIYVPRG